MTATLTLDQTTVGANARAGSPAQQIVSTSNLVKTYHTGKMQVQALRYE